MEFFLTGGATARQVELYIPLGLRYASSLTCSVWDSHPCSCLVLPCARAVPATTETQSCPLFQGPVHLTPAVRNKSGIRGIVHMRLPLDFLLGITPQRMNSAQILFPSLCIYNAQDNRLSLLCPSSSSTLGITGKANSFSSYGWRKSKTLLSWFIPALWIFTTWCITLSHLNSSHSDAVCFAFPC